MGSLRDQILFFRVDFFLQRVSCIVRQTGSHKSCLLCIKGRDYLPRISNPFKLLRCIFLMWLEIKYRIVLYYIELLSE